MVEVPAAIWPIRISGLAPVHEVEAWCSATQ